MLIICEIDDNLPNRFDLASALLVITSHSVLARESRLVVEPGVYEKAVDLDRNSWERRPLFFAQLESAIRRAATAYLDSIVGDQLRMDESSVPNKIQRRVSESCRSSIGMKDLSGVPSTIVEDVLREAFLEMDSVECGESMETMSGRVGEALLWSCWDFTRQCLQLPGSGEVKEEPRSKRQRRSTERYLMERWDRLGKAQKAAQHQRDSPVKGLTSSVEGFRLKNPFLSTHFRRLIVDEGHQLSGPAALSSFRLMCHLISATSRWVVTGTPLSQDPETGAAQLQRLLEFIRHPSAFRFPNSLASPFSRLLRRMPESVTLSKPSNPTDLLSSDVRTSASSNGLIATSKLGPGPLSAAFFLHCILNEVLVIHSKSQISQLPPLYGPTLYRLHPTDQERNSYNDLVEVTQRNLFLTYFSRRNVSSLLYPGNRSLATETLTNLHLACLCDSSSHFYIKDEDATETIQMLTSSKEEEAFAGCFNHCFYPRESDRIEFIRQVNILIILLSICQLTGSSKC